MLVTFLCFFLLFSPSGRRRCSYIRPCTATCSKIHIVQVTGEGNTAEIRAGNSAQRDAPQCGAVPESPVVDGTHHWDTDALQGYAVFKGPSTDGPRRREADTLQGGAVEEGFFTDGLYRREADTLQYGTAVEGTNVDSLHRWETNASQFSTAIES